VVSWIPTGLALAALGVGALVAQTPQQPPGGTTPGTTPGQASGAIAGRVIDASTGQPVAGAIVALGGGSFAPVRTSEGIPVSSRPPNLITGGDGQFAFRGLPGGTFTIAAARSGYLPGAYGRLRPGGCQQSITIDQAEQRADVLVRMFRVATITGTVADDLGEPVVGASVVASRRVRSGGRPVPGSQGSATTDDRGMYRIGGLLPGEYTVGVRILQVSVPPTVAGMTPAGTIVSRDHRFVLGTGGALGAVQDGTGRLHAYATTYYQSARTSGQATPVTVQSGEARTGVDITLHLLPAFTVAGRVVTPDGQLAGQQMRLTPTDTGGQTPEANNALVATDAEGSFVFFGVPSGRYLLETSRTTRSGPAPASETTTWALVPLTVGASDVTGLTVVTQPGLIVSGRVELEGNAPASGSRLLGAFGVEADGLTRMMANFSVMGPITPFATRGLPPGRYRTHTVAPAGWAVKSVMAGGIDIADTPFELESRDLTDVVITLTDRP